MTEKDLSPEEQSMLALHDLILSAFRERFGEAIIGGEANTPGAMNAGSPSW